MWCSSCGSESLTEFTAEIDIHFPGLRNLDNLPVLVYPKLLVCLECGFTQFTIPEAELQCLAAQGIAA